MATFSTLQQSTVPDDNSVPSSTDLSWQFTPRTSAQELMAALLQQQAASQAPTVPQRSHRQSTLNNTGRRPQCTHMTMNRLYGEHICQVCGKVPSIGWVYVCRQDELMQQPTTLSESADALPVLADTEDYFEAQASVAESISMSESVIKQMRAGEYTFDQVEILLQQRRHVIDVIRKAQGSSAYGTPKAGSRYASQLPAENIIASAGTTAGPPTPIASTSVQPTPASAPANVPADSMSNTPTKSRSKASKKSTCHYQVCHSCRPFFQDRLHMSFDTALHEDMPAVTEDEITKLPLLNVDIVRNLGQQQPASNYRPTLSLDTTGDLGMHQSDGSQDDTTSSEWTADSTTSSEVEAERLALERDDPHPCPASGYCPVFHPDYGCAYDQGFDDGRRAMVHGFVRQPEHTQAMPDAPQPRLRRMQGSVADSPGGSSATGSSISLPEPITPPDSRFGDALSHRLAMSGKAATVCGVMSHDRKPTDPFIGYRISDKESTSSHGSELEVNGGVALTEEAVGSGVPDIATAEQAEISQ